MENQTELPCDFNLYYKLNNHLICVLSPINKNILLKLKIVLTYLRDHQMVNTEIRLIIFFAATDGEALYSQQKQDQELTVAQTMNSLLPNSD